ncbi:MAG: diacylglycerol kinase family protein [Cyclobacteriaceae bacterium]
MTRKLFVVGNLFSGNKKTDKILQRFSDFLQARSLPFEVHDTNQDGNATLTTKRLDESFTDLVIVGGDGTINEAVNGLDYNIPVSIIPAGTGNDFVKNVELGKTRQDQFETAINGSVRKIDLGKCNERIFLNGVGIGFDGQIVEDMVSKRVPLLKGHVAYYYHVLRILGSYGVRGFEYQIDEQSHEKELILLTVGNGTTFGGGFKLMPGAKVDDGLLEVCSIGDLSPLRRFLNIHRLSNGSHGKLGMVEFHQAKTLQVEENEMLFAHIDGERMGRPPFEISVLPMALQLRVKS